MAGKYALYLPFHIIEALENEGFSDAEIGAFVRGVIKYHVEETAPRFDDRSLNLLFSSCKQEFDYNIERYKAKLESCRTNGKKGGAPGGNKNAAGNRGGGAPKGNRNAAKPQNKHNPSVEFEPKKQTQAKQADSELELDLELENSGGTTTTEFLNCCKKAGFRLDRKIAEEILDAGLDPVWLSGEFNFVEFAADTIEERYAAKPAGEQKLLFVSAFAWADLREEYPAWRARRQQEARGKQQQEEAEAEKCRVAEARRNPPATCGNCGAAMDPDDRTCPSCGWMRSFDVDSGAWEFHEPVDVRGLFAAVINKGRPKGASP
jgi:hypothetical protein